MVTEQLEEQIDNKRCGNGLAKIGGFKQSQSLIFAKASFGKRKKEKSVQMGDHLREWKRSIKELEHIFFLNKLLKKW